MSRRRLGLLCAVVALAALSLVKVSLSEPRVHVRWRDGISAAERSDGERRYGLVDGALLNGTTWRYSLQDRSRENVAALVGDPAVEDTSYIDRSAFTVEREVSVSKGPAWFVIGATPSELFQPQTLLGMLASGLMLLTSRHGSEPRRRAMGIVVLAVFAAAAYAMPFDQVIRMGDFSTYVADREQFVAHVGVREVAFEAHLSYVVLARLDSYFGSTPDAPRRAFVALMRLATAGFVLSALLIGVVERWSPLVMRYLGLALLAPLALMYFGYRELGHLSLSVAAFPLLARGFRQGTKHLEAGSLFAGLGAAFHGFGLLSIAGAALAALGTPGRLGVRCWLALRVIAWSTAAYLGWIAVYVIVLKLPIVGHHADSIPFRPWFADDVASRVNYAIFGAKGLRDIAFSLWVVGAPLLVLVPMLWHEWRDETRWVLLYSVPSLVFIVVFWPVQGLGVEMDLVFAAFPAVYALAWLCAHGTRPTAWAAVLLVSAHLAFWRILSGVEFVNNPIN